MKQKRLVIFGDSFASTNIGVSLEESSGVIWFVELAKKLGLEIKNYAHPGTSFEYSIREFGRYISTIDYCEDDIIIFVMTSIYRSPILSEDIPPHFASYMTSFLDGSLSKDHMAYEHYFKNKEMYKSLHKNYDTYLADTIRKTLIITLKQLKNTCLVIPAFESSFDFSKKNDPNILLAEDTSTIVIKSNLYDISEKEIIEAGYPEFRNFFKRELRNCHLCNTNNTILAEQLYKCIENKNSDHFDEKKYKQNFIKMSTNSDEVDVSELPYFNPYVYSQ